MQSPSVLTSTSSSSPEAPLTPVEAMEAFGISSFPSSESSSSRRQRISMACQYCRHRCCGSSPCRNCTRAHRTCDYSPVPEEVNKATREKKAQAKASKVAQLSSPSVNYLNSPATNYEYTRPQVQRPVHLGHRRSSSTPNFHAPYTPPAAPALHSPAMFESSTWMYDWSSTPVPVPAPYPSVLEPAYTYTPVAVPQIFVQPELETTHSRSPSVESVDAHPAWTTPQFLAPAAYSPSPMSIKTFSSPSTPSTYYTPTMYSTPYQPQPFLYSPSPLAQTTYSPTLAPALPVYQKDPLVGLGIGMPEMEMYHTPQMMSEEYFVQY